MFDIDSTAKELWEALCSGATSITDLINNRIAESLILEYKTVPANYQDGTLRATVSRVVSGFANSAGGIVLWGVATGGKGDSRDVPVDVPGVTDLESFIHWLKDLIPNAVQPACMTDTKRISPTVVGTYIPQSDLPPHQAVLEKNKPYYTRLDGQFKVMEYHMLADMFGRRRRPSLILGVEHRGTNLQDGPGLSENATVSTFYFSLRNEGRGPARYPTAVLKINHGGSRVTWKELGPFTKRYRNDTIECSVGIDRIVYPSTRMFVGKLEVTWHRPDKPVIIEGKIQAEDMTPRSAIYTVDSQGNIREQAE